MIGDVHVDAVILVVKDDHPAGLVGAPSVAIGIAWYCVCRARRHTASRSGRQYCLACAHSEHHLLLLH